MPIYRMKFNSNGQISRWQQFQGLRGWKNSEKPIPGLMSEANEWYVKKSPIMFEAHHLSTIIDAMKDFKNMNIHFSGRNPAIIEHQYWQSSKKQNTSTFSNMNNPNAKAFAEKFQHVHKILIYEQRHVVAIPGKGRKIADFNVQTTWSASQVATLLEQKKNLMIKSPNIGQDAADEFVLGGWLESIVDFAGS